MKTYIFSFITDEGMLVLNFIFQAVNLKEALLNLEDEHAPRVVLSCVVMDTIGFKLLNN